MSEEIFKVFILEDMPVDLQLVKRQVRKFNDTVLFAVARIRAEFEEKLLAFQPDIVLSDYNLPDMNGLEALLYVREHLDNTPFIFITGILNDEEKVAETILRGASGYLLKENLRNLPTVMTSIVDRNAATMRAREEQWERQRQINIKLQRSMALLREEGDFPRKDAVLAALREVGDYLSA